MRNHRHDVNHLARDTESSALKRQVNNALIAERGDLDFSNPIWQARARFTIAQWDAFTATAIDC
jgi:hypothetical protein